MRLTKWDKSSIVKAVMADVPKPDAAKRRIALQAQVVKLMSPECRKVFNKNPKALKDYYVGHMLYDGLSHSSQSIVCGDVKESAITPLIEAYKKEDETIDKARRSLVGAIEACSTLKQLNDRLPEFKKYFPTEEKPVANLPALANVVADLSKLGWPKQSGAKK